MADEPVLMMGFIHPAVDKAHHRTTPPQPLSRPRQRIGTRRSIGADTSDIADMMLNHLTPKANIITSAEGCQDRQRNVNVPTAPERHAVDRQPVVHHHVATV